MFRKRCQLCGGKLVNNKCTLCGLDNSKTDADYQVNQSSCDHRPMTHIHTERQQTEAPQGKARKSGAQKNPQTKQQKVKPIAAPTEQRKKAYGNTRAAQKGSVKWIVAVLFFVMLVNGMKDRHEYLSGIVDQWIEEDDTYESECYSEVTRELAEEGDYYEVELEPGTYVVGVHLPEGTYTAEEMAEAAGGWFALEDRENQIYRIENFRDHSVVEAIEDIRCYTGAKIQCGGPVRFYSSNAQTEAMAAVENPLTAPVTVKDGDIAGETFPAGTYDIVTEEGNLSFGYIVPGTVLTENAEEDEEEDIVDSSAQVTDQFVIDTDDGIFVRRNLYLPEGTRLVMEAGVVELVPSEKIPESYEEYYDLYE